MKFLVWLLVPVAFGGREKSGAELTEELIIAASPFVQDDRGWRPSSIARQLLLSSGDQAWKRRSSGDEGGGVEEEEQQGRSGKALYIPYSPGPDALRWAGNIHRNTLSRIRLLHVAWVRPVGELCVAAATAATAAGPRGETHFRKRL